MTNSSSFLIKKMSELIITKGAKMAAIFFQILVSVSILPMLYVSWKSDQIKNFGSAKKVMRKNLKRRPL